MIDLTEKKYTATKLGFKIRLHRIVFQMLLSTYFIYQFGWIALLFGLAILLCDILPFGQADVFINPWLRKEFPPKLAATMKAFPDLTLHTCAYCEAKALTIDVSPASDPLAELETTGIWVDPGEGSSFVLCDQCAEGEYVKGRLGYGGHGDAFLL
jgi:hypothetical protein